MCFISIPNGIILLLTFARSCRAFAGFADPSYSFLIPGSDTEQILQLLTENSNIGLDGVYLYNTDNQTTGRAIALT